MALMAPTRKQALITCLHHKFQWSFNKESASYQATEARSFEVSGANDSFATTGRHRKDRNLLSQKSERAVGAVLVALVIVAFAMPWHS
jgi:hypothetical protein